MNAAIALVHRCSEHGPSIVFTSQPFHSTNHSTSLFALPSFRHAVCSSQPPPSLLENLKNRKPNAPCPSVDQLHVSPASPSLPPPATGEIQGSLRTKFQRKSLSSPAILISLPDESSVVCANKNDPDGSTCTSCNPVYPVLPREIRAVDVKGFVHLEPGNDDELAENVCYIGYKTPKQRTLYAALQQACMRSFSCETVPGREGPVFFGDEKHGYVLSYMFTVKDIHAHGGQRLFSFVVLMTDRLYLVASWVFLVDKLKSLANDLKQFADRVDRANRERRNKKGAKEMLPEYFLKRQAGTPLRSLVELTGLPDLFSLLHASFSWILRTCARRLKERECAMITKLQDEKKSCSRTTSEASSSCTEAPAMPILHSSTLNGTPPTAPSESAPSVVDQLCQRTPLDQNVENSPKKPARENALDDAFPTECSSNHYNPVSVSLADLERCLGFAKFRKLVWNVVIGNQVIVKGPDRWLVVQVLNSLKELLPESMIREVEYSTSYEESWMCNFLGLEEKAPIPDHIESSQIIIVTVYCHENSDTPRFAIMHGVDPPSTNCTPPAFYASTPAQIELQRLMVHFDAPDSQIDTIGVANPCANTLKDRVLLVDQMLRIISFGGNTKLTHVRLDSLRRVWMGHAQQLYRLVLSGCAENQEKRNTLMKALKVHETDLSVLRFWMGGVRKCSQSCSLRGLHK